MPAEPGPEGISLKPWLTDPSRPSDRPIITSYGQHNHALQIDRWRYSQYEDGSRELYDHATDPNEWTNLAATPQGERMFSEVEALFPRSPRPPAAENQMPTNAYFLEQATRGNAP